MRSPIPALFVLSLFILASCGGIGQLPTPEPTPTPAEYIARAGVATQEAKSLHVAIELSGKPVAMDSTGLFTIRTMTGDIQRPDGALAILKVRSAIGVAEVRTVSLAGKQYITNPVTRQWQCLAPGTAFDPSELFDAQRGIAAILQQGIEQPSMIGLEEIDGRPNHHLRGVIAADRLHPISAGLLGAGPVTLDVWADGRTSRIAKLILVDSATDATDPSTWTITFTDYDKPVEVRAPADCP